MPNPFHTGDFNPAAEFCPRDEEFKQLLNNTQMDLNTILLGMRQIGKTTLVKQFIRHIENENNRHCIYVNINASSTIDEFSELLLQEIVKEFREIKSNNIDLLINRSNPQLLLTVLESLDKLNKKILIVIDDFQQIINYPDKDFLQVFQNSIQKLKRINFIFCCSNEFALNELAGNETQTFFANSDLIQLNPIKTANYNMFIGWLFNNNGQSISEEAIDFILDWTRCHTHYTQSLCKRIFFNAHKEIELENVHDECGQVLSENESSFYIYRNLLSPVQWILLKAIAKEEKVYHPTAKQFLSEHKIGTPANVQRALDALIQKEMVIASRDEKGRYYQVQDCFLSRWLEGID